MTEEIYKESEQKTIKVTNVLRLSPEQEKQLYKRPIDLKIDEIRRRLQAMVKVKIKRSGSEQKLKQNSKERSEANSNINQLYNILRPKNMTNANTLPIITQEQKKISKKSETKIQLNPDSFINKLKTEIN